MSTRRGFGGESYLLTYLALLLSLTQEFAYAQTPPAAVELPNPSSDSGQAGVQPGSDNTTDSSNSNAGTSPAAPNARDAARLDALRNRRVGSESLDYCAEASTNQLGGSACRPDQSDADLSNQVTTVTDTGLSAIAPIVQQGMTLSGQEAANRGDHAKAARKTGEGQLTQGALSTVAGAVQLFSATYFSGFLGSSHSTDQKEQQEKAAKIGTAITQCEAATARNPSISVEGDSNTTYNCGNENDRTKSLLALEERRALLESSAAQHSETNDAQNTAFLAGTVSGLKNVTSGGLLTATGMQNLKTGDEFIPSAPPQQAQYAGESNTGNQQNLTPAPVFQPNAFSAEAAPPEAGEEGLSNNLPTNLLPPPGGGRPSPGGLAGPTPAPTNGLVSPPGTSDKGGGGGGGGLGSGSGVPNDEQKNQNAEALSANGVKFGDPSAGGAGPGFNSAGGGGSDKRVGNTGMDLAGILGGLIPKKEEEEKPGSSILDFEGKGNHRGVASNEKEDGSILGKNANLFARVSETMASKYKDGKLLKAN